MGAHWHDVARIFESAVGRSPAERAEFVRQACLGDSDLRREVESLLAEDTRRCCSTGRLPLPRMQCSAIIRP